MNKFTTKEPVTAVLNKSKILTFVFAFIIIVVGIVVYSLQFSAIAYKLDCNRESKNCILKRTMVIGGDKEVVFPIESIKDVEISFHRNENNVWVVTHTDRLPLATYSNQTTQANKLMISLQEYLHTPTQNSFTHAWP